MGRTDPDDVSVTEKSPGYSASTDGPLIDAASHSRETPMPVQWVSEISRGPAPASNVPDMRKSLRKADDVERDRVRKLPSWLPLVAAGVFLIVLLAGGVAVVVRMAQSNAPKPKPEKPPIEEVEGVPVRKGLNQQDR